MAEPIVSFLVESIGRLLMDEGKFLSGVRDEAEKLHSELKMMRALLKDADEKQHEAEVVKGWVSQSKDVTYEAENLLEDYVFKLGSRRSKKGRLSKLKRYACILNECYIHHNVGLEIQSLNTRISNLRTYFRDYGIRAVTERERTRSSSSQQQMRMSYSSVAEDEDFVGFGWDVEILVQALVKEDDFFGHYDVVSISGMGGSGKTMLARNVYNHPSVKNHFNSFAWVCISQQWQARNILQGILVSFLPKRRQEIEKWIDDEIVRELLRLQQNKKCLVVLDDIWSTDAWECIKIAFPVRKKGNKILITTRNKDVAIHIGPHGYHHEPRLLSQDEGWELLQKKALKQGSIHTGYGDIGKLESLGKEMVNICGGLPLAIVVLGGVLATRVSFHEWNLVYRNIKSYLGKGKSMQQDEGEVRKILALSYNDLPYKLKPCFLYLSGFPEDEEIPEHELYHLWIAEGMVFAEDRIGDETMVDVAERYLEELAKRCIVHLETRVPTIRKYKSCRLHDLMRDLCLAKAREENFLKVIDYEHENGMVSTSSTAGNIHRMMIYISEKDAEKYVPPKMEATKHLRTLVFCATGGGNLIAQLAASQFNKLKMLRSLTIEGVITPELERITGSSGIPDDVFKLPIGNLIHLRCLIFRNSHLVISPLSVSSLEHLETLELTWGKIIWSEKVPLKLRRLRYLYVMFPHNDFKMQIYVSNTLEVMIGLKPGTVDVRHISELSNLCELQAHLRVDDTNSAEEIIKYISISHQLKLADIVFEVTESCSQEREAELLEQLFRSNLQYLHLRGRLRKLPEYNSQIFRNLSELRLENSQLQVDPMETLENLPRLQKLVLWIFAFVGTEMVCHSFGFPELRYLVLYCLPRLGKWTVDEGAMNNLSHLEMSWCEGLTTVPHGLCLIPTLQEVLLDNMSVEFVSDYFLKLRMYQIPFPKPMPET